MKIDSYSAPMMVSWQLTRNCNLACLHCCTGSAPGRPMSGELDWDQAMGVGAQIIAAEIPYVMLCGGEPTIVDHFMDVAELLGRGGVFLKVESNGQLFSTAIAKRLSNLPIRSIQISLDASTQETYGRQRPGAALNAVYDACRSVRDFGMPLEIAFAPTRLNIHEAEDVIYAALEFGAFRFNTGGLMRLGTAGRLWDRLEPSSAEYEKFLKLLRDMEAEIAGRMELAFRPFWFQSDMVSRVKEPPGTLLLLPDGKVKVTAGLPFICGDLKKQSLAEVWDDYRAAWRDPRVARELGLLAADNSRLAQADRLVDLKGPPAEYRFGRVFQDNRDEGGVRPAGRRAVLDPIG